MEHVGPMVLCTCRIAMSLSLLFRMSMCLPFEDISKSLLRVLDRLSSRLFTLLLGLDWLIGIAVVTASGETQMVASSLLLMFSLDRLSFFLEDEDEEEDLCG